MKKSISSLFLTTFLVHAPFAIYAMEEEKAEKEPITVGVKQEYDEETPVCRLTDYKATFNEARESLEQDPRSLEAYLKLIEVARSGVCAGAEEEQLNAVWAYDKAHAFIMDPDSSSKARCRIAIEIADLLVSPSPKRNYSDALTLLTDILASEQHFATFPQILNNIIDSEDAERDEKEKAHNLLLEYALRFRIENVVDEYSNIFKFYKANPV